MGYFWEYWVVVVGVVDFGVGVDCVVFFGVVCV